jgi:peptidoglycan/LPS O-acetylase OafA/YrhL
LYREKITRGQIGFRQFAVLRFSRLYPLHLVTLVLVAVGQYAMWHGRGAYFVYRYNDLRHFLLHLFFASDWGLQAGYSFNAPVWSVSHEILLYGVFFLVCRLGGLRLWQVVTLVLLGLLLEGQLPLFIGLNAAEFFAGGVTYLIYASIMRRGWRMPGYVLLSILAGAWTIRSFLPPDDFACGYISFGAQSGGLLLHTVANGLWLFFTKQTCAMVMFPLTVLVVALLDSNPRFSWAKVGWLGEISYSSYLLHFPLQLLSALLGLALGWDVAVFNSPPFFLCFFAVLLTLSWLSYRYFEMPCQRWLRRQLA